MISGDSREECYELIGEVPGKVTVLLQEPVRRAAEFRVQPGLPVQVDGVGVHDDENCALACRLQLNGDFLCDNTAEGPAEQMIRPGFLHGAYPLDIVRCHARDGGSEPARPVQARILQRIDRVICREVPGKRHVRPAHSSCRVDAEKGRLSSVYPDREQRADGERRSPCRGAQGGDQPGRGRRLEHCPHAHRLPPRAQPLDQLHRQQRMAAQRKEIILRPDRGQPQHFREHRAQDLLPHRRRAPALARAA